MYISLDMLTDLIVNCRWLSKVYELGMFGVNTKFHDYKVYHGLQTIHPLLVYPFLK